MRPSEIVRQNRKHGKHEKPTQEFEINGKKVKTNYGTNYPMWNGNNAPAKYEYPCGSWRTLQFRETTEDAFNKAIAEGYTEIRFVETATYITGYHNVVIMVHKKEV